MPRAPRIQFGNALYHVINRGNYRLDVFELDSTRRAFELCLFEACELHGWLLHAYCIMRNHFHLALQTPRANLVQGMHWLQCTFSTRFNRLRQENGHLFQGRYRAIVIEPGLRLCGVVNYIHLNPVEAKLLPAEDLRQFPWSSFNRLQRPGRPTFLVCKDWLFEMGGLQDTAAGWTTYHQYLIGLAANEEEQRKQAFDTLCHGWANGTAGWQKELSDDQKELFASYALRGRGEAVELKELVWSRALDEALAKAVKIRSSLVQNRKAAPWKIELAEHLRATTTVTNSWIARELHMGTADSVSVYLSKRRRQAQN